MKLIKVLTLLILSLIISPYSIAYGQEKPNVTVTTSFIYDIVKKITADTVSIELIIPAGSDPHLYTPLAGDLDKILNADIILYHGFHFEAQMAEVLTDYGYAATENFDSEALIYVDGGQDVDPHYWFNLDLYKQSVEEITRVLTEEIPENQELYHNNAQRYLDELDELNQWAEERVGELALENRILVTPHDAFTYFAEAFDFQVYAPQGISTQSEVSNDQIIQTVNFVVENEVPALFMDTTSNPQTLNKLKEGIAEKRFEVVIVAGQGSELYSDSLAPIGQENDNFIEMFQHNMNLIIDNLTK